MNKTSSSVPENQKEYGREKKCCSSEKHISFGKKLQPSNVDNVPGMAGQMLASSKDHAAVTKARALEQLALGPFHRWIIWVV